MRNILATFLTILMLLPVSAMGEIGTIKQSVNQMFRGAQSLDDVRTSSIANAKMAALTEEKQSTEESKKDSQQASQGLTAADWLKKALSLWDGEKYKDPKKAIEYLSNAIKLQPDDADAYNRRGNVYYKLGQFQLAIKDYNEVIRLKPDYVNAYYSLANAYYKIGQYQRAVEDLKIAAGLGHEVAQIILKSYGGGNILVAKKLGKVEANRQYKEIKGIVLKNGDVIEGQIISIDSDRVKIRTKEGSILFYNFNEEVQEFIKNEVAVIKTPEKKSQPIIENDKSSEEAALQYKGIRGIVLKNGDVIEEQVISIKPDRVRLRTKQGKILSYDLQEEVQGFIKDEVAVIKTPERQSQPSVENDKASVEADPQYKKMRGIELMSGEVIEGEIICVNTDIVKIRAKDGKVVSYSFKKEVMRFIEK